MTLKLPKPLLDVEFIDGDDGHFYRVNGKDIMYPGVTTILRLLGKPALVPWAAKKAAEAFAARMAFQDWLAPASQRVINEIIDFAAKAPTRERDTAGAKGTDVHEEVNKFLEFGEQPDNPSESFKRFMDWWMTNEWQNVSGDLPVVSETLAFGGRLDGLMEDEKERLVLFDLKTGKGVYPEAFLQLGAYSLALQETYGIRPRKAGILHIRPEFAQWYELDALAKAEAGFRRVRDLYDMVDYFSKQIGRVYEAERRQ